MLTPPRIRGVRELTMYNPTPFQNVVARERTGALAFLRRVYGLFFMGIISAVGGGLLALYAGRPLEVVTREGALQIPPMVAWGLSHPILMLLVYFGAFFVASFARRMPGVNVVALLGYTFVTGVFLAPVLFFAMSRAAAGATLDPSPVRDAFLLTGAAFGGLSGYVLISRKDFSFMGAALNMGLWVIIGASILGFFIGSNAFHLAVASVGVLLFAGYILYDTSRILHDGAEREDAVGAALRLFLDVVNLFLFLLRILSSSRDR